MTTICPLCKTSFEHGTYKVCDICRSKRRERYKSNREKELAYQHNHYLEHKDEKHQYYIQNRERYAMWGKANWERHKEKYSVAYKQWYQNNKEHHFENVARWKKNHPEEWGAIKVKGSHARRARLNNATGTFTFNEIKELAHQQENKCYYCSKPFFNGNLERDRHIEHKIPLSRGGSNDISNIVLSCSKCNREKYVKTEEEFLAVLNPQN